MYCFEPHYSKSNYTGHFTPNGAQVCPLNSTGMQFIDGWEFYYQKWMPNPFDGATFVRTGSTRETLKPISWHGCLDVKILKKHGLDAGRIQNDPLFFF